MSLIPAVHSRCPKCQEPYKLNVPEDFTASALLQHRCTKTECRQEYAVKLNPEVHLDYYLIKREPAHV